MSPRIEIAEGADQRIFANVQKLGYLKGRWIPSATCIRLSIAQNSRCMRFKRAI